MGLFGKQIALVVGLRHEGHEQYPRYVFIEAGPVPRQIQRVISWSFTASTLASGRYHQSLDYVFILSLTAAAIQRMPNYEKSLQAKSVNKGLDRTMHFSAFCI